MDGLAVEPWKPLDICPLIGPPLISFRKEELLGPLPLPADTLVWPPLIGEGVIAESDALGVVEPGWEIGLMLSGGTRAGLRWLGGGGGGAGGGMVIGMESGRGDLKTSEAGVFSVGPLIKPLLLCEGVCVSEGTLGCGGKQGLKGALGRDLGEKLSRVAS